VVDGSAFRRYFAVIRLRIKLRRRGLGLSQEETAGRIRIDVRMLQRFEAREPDISDARLKTLYKIAEGLDLDPGELLRAPTGDELQQLEDWQ
jgi:transcriptional regulator with XRE-family HTH domain